MPCGYWALRVLDNESALVIRTRIGCRVQPLVIDAAANAVDCAHRATRLERARLLREPNKTDRREIAATMLNAHRV